MSAAFSLAQQVALLTGAASGIGRATAQAFARAGAKVVVSDVQEKGGIETVQMIKKVGGEAIFIACDVSNPEQVKSLIAQAVAKYQRIDHAFNNAGTEGHAAPLHESSTENWNTTLGINLSGVYWCMAVLWLCNPNAAFVIGTEIILDGGWCSK